MSKQLPWFRVHTRMVDDDKLKLLAFEDRWHFVALLCLKGEGLLDKGDAPGLLMRKVAVKLGLDVRSLEEVARRLSEVGLVDAATLQPAKWDELQMRSDSDQTAAERKRRSRANQKAAKPVPSNDVTGDGVPVTDQSRVTGTDVTRTDIDTDIDKETKVDKTEVELDSVGGAAGGVTPAAAAPTAPPPPPSPESKPAVAHRLPKDWVLPSKWGQWALEERKDLSEGDVRREAACFADYWHAKGGADARKVDWLATWRNWIRKCDGPRNKPSGARGGNNNPGAMAAILG